MKSLLWISCALLLFTGCRREKTSVLKGRLLDSCMNGLPLANEKVYFRIGKFGGWSEAIAETTTDANGYFSVSYTTKSHYGLSMSVAGQKIVTGIDPRKNIDFGDVYSRLVAKTVVKVQVNNPYAAVSDLLKVSFAGTGTSFQMPTPFHDTVFPVTEIDQIQGSQNYATMTSNGTKAVTAYWSFTNGLFPPQEKEQSVSQCTAVPDTIVITID